MLLTFKHFPIIDRFVPQSAMGWRTMLDILHAGVLGEEAPNRSELTRKNAELYGVDLSNLER